MKNPTAPAGLSTYEVTKLFVNGLLEGMTVSDLVPRCSDMPYRDRIGSVVKGLGGSDYRVLSVSKV